MNLNELYNNYGAKKNSKRIGRGIGSGKGKTGGRGVKGQKARAGVAIKGFEGGQTPLKKRLPKRGFNCPSKQDMQIVNISQIENMIEKNNLNSSTIVNKELLLKFGMIKKMNKPVKILSGNKNINSRLSIHVHSYSKSAKENVENYGGKAIYKK